MNSSTLQGEPTHVARMTVSAGVLTRYLPGVILLLGLGSMATQGVAVATGRDFAFGLIPKLNPGGTRNIPVWFASSTFAVSAASASLVALVRQGSERASARVWWVLAILLFVLSAERMAAPTQALAGSLGSSAGLGWAGYLLIVSAIGAVPAAYVRCMRDLSSELRPHFRSAATVFAVGAGLCVAASGNLSPNVPYPLSRALILSAGRLLELGGATLFLQAVVRYVRSRVCLVCVTVHSVTGRLLEHRYTASGLEVRISVPRVGRVLTAITGLLLIASFASAFGREIEKWDIERTYRLLFVDFEGNLPTWYSSLLLLACGAVAGGIAAVRHHAGDRQWRKWALLGAVFVALSADEAAALHELSVAPLRDLVGNNPWLRYPLVLPGAGVIVAAFMAFAVFIRSLPATTRHAVKMGGGLLALGALGVETAGGWFDPVLIGYNVPYLILTTVEEGLELLGVIVILIGLLRHVEYCMGPITVASASQRNSCADCSALPRLLSRLTISSPRVGE